MTPPVGKAASPRGWQGAFLFLALIWGMSFLFIKVGDQALAPLQVALARLLLGALTLLIVLAASGDRLPRDARVWGHLAVAGLLFNALPFALFAYGETQVTSVLAGIWNATTPLLALVAGILMLPDERPSRERTAGIGVGFAGVLVVLGVWHGLEGRALLGNLACLAASACYGLGYPYVRRNLARRAESPVALAAAQVLCGTAEVGLVTLLFTAPPRALGIGVVGSMVALGALGTGVAYILNYRLIRDVGSTVASTVTYLIPVVSTVAGVLFLGEPLSWNEPVGALIVITGVALAQGRVTSHIPLFLFPRSGGR